MTKEEIKVLKDEVFETLNQLAIKLKDIDKEYPETWDSEFKKDRPNPKFCKENEFLLIVRNFSIDMTQYGGSEVAVEYYSSSQF